MAYYPDDIFCHSVEAEILDDELKRKEKSKKSRKSKKSKKVEEQDTIFDHLTFESGIFLGIVIGIAMTLITVVLVMKLF